MSNVIFKFKLKMEDEQKIMMPKGAKILSVQVQGESPCIWALVNPDIEQEERSVAIIGTGNPFWCHDYTFIDTFQLRGAFVFHTFIR